MTDVKPVKVKITKDMPVDNLPANAGYAVRNLASVFDTKKDGVFSKKEAEEFNNWSFKTTVDKEGNPTGKIEAKNRETNTTIILKFDPDKAKEQLKNVTELYKNNFSFGDSNGKVYALAYGLEEGSTVSVDLTNQKMELNNVSCDCVEVGKDASVELNNCEVEKVYCDKTGKIEHENSKIGKWVDIES